MLLPAAAFSADRFVLLDRTFVKRAPAEGTRPNRDRGNLLLLDFTGGDGTADEDIPARVYIYEIKKAMLQHTASSSRILFTRPADVWAAVRRDRHPGTLRSALD